MAGGTNGVSGPSSSKSLSSSSVGWPPSGVQWSRHFDDPNIDRVDAKGIELHRVEGQRGHGGEDSAVHDYRRCRARLPVAQGLWSRSPSIEYPFDLPQVRRM